ncbi:MAG: hypothetical protein IJS50_01190 [Desulfovibrio sp.]|nr:hypothetical protein [Desulfovibrio sp.]
MLDLTLHHLGIATRDIASELKVYALLGYTQESEIFCDKNLGINGVFITQKGCPRLELLENLYENGPLTSWLNQGIKIYHMAFETVALEKSITDLVTRSKAKIIIPPTNSVYFTGVAFVMLPNLAMIELVQLR